MGPRGAKAAVSAFGRSQSPALIAFGCGEGDLPLLRSAKVVILASKPPEVRRLSIKEVQT